MAAPDDVTEFSSSSFRRGKAIRFGLTIAVLGVLITSMASGPRTSLVDVYIGVTGVGIAIIAIGFARAFGAGIYVGDGGVVAKTTYSTKHWNWETLDRASSLDTESRGGPLYLGNSFSRGHERIRVVPILYFTNGLNYRLYGLKIVTTSPYDGQWLDDAVAEINRRLELRRGTGVKPS